MTTLLTSISGQFGKIILLGTLFPVLIVSILNELLVIPILPFGGLQDQLRKAATGEDKWTAVTLVLIVVVIAGIIYNLNIPIIRAYEGYPWKDSYLGTLWAQGKKERFRKVVPLRLAMRYLRRDLQKLDPNSDLPDSLQSEQNKLALYINSELPDREDLVLPTRLGNVIRCFERYSSVAYGMDAIVFWPRLVAEIDSAFASTIDEAKTSFDFMLNCSFLLLISGILTMIIELLLPTPLSTASVVHWLWRVILLLALSALFYIASIGRAKAWGAQVKSAFDLYRFELLKTLGYQQLQPLTFFEEKALWQRLSVQLLYADSREKPLPYKGAPTRVSASPVGIQLAIKRQVSAAAVTGNVAVQITVQNKDRRAADLVVLSETLPEGFKPLLNSVHASAGTLLVSNLMPLEMLLDKIAPGTSVTIAYTLKPVAA
jgi:hypothetical protein